MLRRFIIYWLPLLLWMVAIFSASTDLGSPQHTSRFVRPFLLWLNPHISEAAIDQAHYCIRKTAHSVEYAVLGFLIWRVVHSAAAMASRSTASQFRLALHQMFVPSRNAAVADVLLDTCGAGLGLAVTWCIVRLRRSK